MTRVLRLRVLTAARAIFRAAKRRYTACQACKEDPKKPPLLAGKAARIIHDEQEKMIYFEQAQLEFFGQPVAFFPYFSTPDPSVKRKSGFLMPAFGSDTKLGLRADAPISGRWRRTTT